MFASNAYDTLGVSRNATHQEIKESYRRLVKIFHPDSNSDTANHQDILRINAAYEILKDRQRRQDYDRQFNSARVGDSDRQNRTVYAQNQYRQEKQTKPNTDEHLQGWFREVYRPVNQILQQILLTLADEVEQLSADPFDDELMADFQAYLHNCSHLFKQAQMYWRSMPNPAMVAGAAANIYYSLNQVEDGLEQLDFFTLNYDEHYLHTGQELMRIAFGLLQESQVAIQDMCW